LTGGSFAVAALNPLGVAGAQDNTQSPPAASAPAGRWGGMGHGPGRPGADVVNETLGELVANGTITQAQADAIRGSVKSKIEAHRAENPNPRTGNGPGKGERGFAFGQDVFETVAKTIGVDAQQLRTELRDGNKSIAQAAKDHNVDPQKVIDALVADANTRIDAAVTSGKLPADKAAKVKAGIADQMTKLVNRQGR
jgi:hypothetical protein